MNTEKKLKNRIYCISDYGDWNLDENHYNKLLKLLKNYFIYYKGSNSNIPNEFISKNNYVKIQNKGSNISDYLRFIVENYPYFPKEVGFIKGNVFPRHISYEIFVEKIKNNGFTPLYWEDKTTNAKVNIINKFIFQQISPGICIEITNNWYTKGQQKGKFYPLLQDMYYKYISKHKLPKYIPFVPGACMIVESEKILRWDKYIFEDLYEAVSYQKEPNPHPVEAWHFERLMLYFFYFDKFQ
jgi:hypothetical protein